MNVRISMFSVMLAIMANVLSLTSSLAQPGPNGIPSIQSCYQLIEFDVGGAPIDLLKSNTYVFIPSGNQGSWPDYWEIQQFNGAIQLPPESNYYGLLGDDFTLTIAPGGIAVVQAFRFENNEFIFNEHPFGFNANADIVIIRPWYRTENPSTLDPGNNYKEFHLRNANEVFDFTLGSNENCNTYEDFFANISTALEGFCGIINPIADLSIHLPTPSDWNSNISQNVNLGQNSSLQHSPTFCDECLTQVAPWYILDPVPCKCANFDLKVTIEPCPNAPENCEELVIVKEVEICCECDVRENPPNTGIKQ